MISLTDNQLEIVMMLARQLAPEKRAAYLQRFAAELGRHSGRINDRNVADAADRSQSCPAHRGVIMVPTVAFIFLFVGLALAMFGPFLSAVTIERPAPRRRRRRRSARRVTSTATQTPLTIVPKDHDHG